jgi:creatinine amidohydrolase
MRLIFFLVFMAAFNAGAQNLPVKWEEILAGDWDKVLEKSGRTVIWPMGVMEKHGPHLPIGTDMIAARSIAELAANIEYAVIYPDFIYGQVYEVLNHPGTITIPSDLLWALMQATVDEMARNGFKKVLILNGHGGNTELQRYFIQAQLERRRDIAVFLHAPRPDPGYIEKLNMMRQSDPSYDQHAGERETSSMLYLRPDLVAMDRANDESGKPLRRLDHLEDVYSWIKWIGNYPNHYAGEGSAATTDLGKLIVDQQVESLVKNLRVIKSEERIFEIMEEFYDAFEKGF